MFNEKRNLENASINPVSLNKPLDDNHLTLAKPMRTYEKRRDKISLTNIDIQNPVVNKDCIEPNANHINSVPCSVSDHSKIRTVDIRKLTGKKFIDGVPHKVSADQVQQFLNGTFSKNFIILKPPLERRKTTDCCEVRLSKERNWETITTNDATPGNVETRSTPTLESSTNDILDISESELARVKITKSGSVNIDKAIPVKEAQILEGLLLDNSPICVQNKLGDVEEIKDVAVNKEVETRKQVTEMGKIKHFKEKSSSVPHNANDETMVVRTIFNDIAEVPNHYPGENTSGVKQPARESKMHSEDDIFLRNRKRIYQRSAQKRYIQQEIEKCLKAKMKKTRKKKLKAAQCQTEIKCHDTWTQTSELPTQLRAEEVSSIVAFNSGDHHFDDIFLSNVNLGTGPKLEPFRNAGETVTQSNLESFVGNCNVPPSRLVNVSTMGYLDVDVHGDMSGLSTRDNKQAFQEYLRNCIVADSAGNLPLHIEVMKNNFNEVRKQLIMLNVWRLSIDTINANHLTPLHLAVIHNCDENIVRFLLDKGADIGCTDSEGNNSMHLAVFHNSSTLLHLLLQKSIDTNFNFNNTFNYEGFTPLLLATIEDKLDMVKMFLEFGADPNIRDQKSGRTPLFHAVENNNMIMVQLLLHHRADKKIKNFSGTTTHDAVFELEGISADIKNMIIGKEIFAVNSTRTDKRKKPTVDKTKEVCTKKLRTVKTYRKINM